MNKNSRSKNDSFEFLDSITKDERFLVPRDYFSNMKEDITKKIDDDLRITPLKSRWKNLKIVASIAALLMLGMFVRYNWLTTPECSTFACLFENANFDENELKAIEDDSKMVLFEDDDELF